MTAEPRMQYQTVHKHAADLRVEPNLVDYESALGVAISLRGGGLIAPAVHDADTKDLTTLMGDLRDLVNRERDFPAARDRRCLCRLPVGTTRARLTGHDAASVSRSNRSRIDTIPTTWSPSTTMR